MPSLGDIFGKGTIGEQLLVWGALNQVIGALIAPGITELSQLANEAVPLLSLSPAEAAAAVNRGYLSSGEGASEAAKGGIDGSRFTTLTDLAGNAPGVDVLAEALRRKIIAESGTGADSTSFEQGIRETNLHDKWTDMVKQLTVQIPSVAEVMNAWLEGQIDEGEAHTRYLQAGGDPTWFQTSYNANGSSPSPNEAATMANRGIIPWNGTGPDAVTFEQAFLEGPWRNKWLDAWRGLAEYLPPPRTVTAMLREGSISESDALTLFEKEGLNPTLAAAYVASASHHATAAAKELSASNVVALYEDHLITRADAQAHLVALRYSAADADLYLALADAKAAAAATKSAVTRLRTLYTTGKNDAATTQQALTDLGLTSDQIAALFAVWSHETAANVRTLTPAQIESAWEYGIMDQPTAIARLVALGYDEVDAWIALSIKNKSPLPNEPAGGPTITVSGP